MKVLELLSFKAVGSQLIIHLRVLVCTATEIHVCMHMNVTLMHAGVGRQVPLQLLEADHRHPPC